MSAALTRGTWLTLLVIMPPTPKWGHYNAPSNTNAFSKALRYGNTQFYLQTSHTCLYSPATQHHRPLAGTHFTVPQRVAIPERLRDEQLPMCYTNQASRVQASLTFRVRAMLSTCHSNKTSAPIANPSNSAQLGGTPDRSPKLHPGPCSGVEMRRGTDTQTRA